MYQPDDIPKDVHEHCENLAEQQEPVKVKCTQCGCEDFCWPEHQDEFVCIDCFFSRKIDKQTKENS